MLFEALDAEELLTQQLFAVPRRSLRLPECPKHEFFQLGLRNNRRISPGSFQRTTSRLGMLRRVARIDARRVYRGLIRLRRRLKLAWLSGESAFARKKAETAATVQPRKSTRFTRARASAAIVFHARVATITCQINA